VRSADILGLALSALWQQKARTLLTTLGVIFGSFVLAASLATSQGVQEAMERISHRSDYLRRIDVRPEWGSKESDIPADELRVTGTMDDAKSARIHKALVERKTRYSGGGPRTPLTRERLQALAGIEHVASVVPSIGLFGWATFNGHTEPSGASSAVPENAAMRRRVVAGRFFDAADERAVLVNEFLLYECGVTDDTALEGVIGKKLRMEFRFEGPPPTGLNFYLQKQDGTRLSPEEASALDKVRKQLPESLERFDLTEHERGVLLNATRTRVPVPPTVIAEEFPIVGVLRLPTDEEWQNRPWEDVGGQVVLPLRTAEELYFRVPAEGKRGLDSAALYADREENVKEIMRTAREMGLGAYGMQEFIERERLMFVLIFGAMTSIAGVALLVAALGIANTMLMSVLERTREVGVMKAVGAGNGHVQLIFLVEGALIGLFGGAAGLVLARLAAIPADARIRGMVSRDLKVELHESLFVFPPWLLLTVLAFTVVVTTLAAVYPARRAAKVNPVTALRHE
jgi:putative ABC transport system permease protein